MWIPKQLIVKNFMTYVEEEFLFQQGIVTLLLGSNLDDQGQKSNGAGKSALLEALAYIYIGSGLKKSVDADLVRNGQKGAYIAHFLYNSRTKDKLLIQREIFIKGSSKLSIIINGEDQKDKFATVPDGNKFLLELIGISRKDLLDCYIVSKEKYVSFYVSGDNEKKEAIARFSKADKLDGIEDKVQKDVDVYNLQLSEIESNIIKLGASIEIYNKQIEEEKTKDQEKVKNDQINQYNSQVKEGKEKVSWYEKNNTILDNHFFRYANIIKEYNRQIELLGKVDYTKEMSEIDKKEEEIKTKEQQEKAKKQSVEKELDEAKEYLRGIETGLKGLIQCPKCLHEFIPDEEFDAKDARETKPIIEKGIETLNDQILKLKSSIESFSTSYDKFDKEREVFRAKIKDFNENKGKVLLKIQRCQNSLKRLKNDISSNEGNIKSLKSNISYVEKLVEQLKQQEIVDKVKELKEKISATEKSIEEHNKSISALEEEKFKHEQWIYNFKRFKSFLANKSIKSIEGITNMMLKKMKSNLQVQLEGYGLLKNGELREKITPYILKDGFNEGSFFKASKGEQGRIELSTILSRQQLINMNSTSGGLDLCWIDEVLESVDGEGIRLIAKGAKNMNRTINIITHVDVIAENDYRVITVEKKNKISKLL